MDTVDASASRQFIENVAYALNGESLDYLVVQHMEPDHCANIQKILELYPGSKSSRKCEDHADDRTVFRCRSGRQEDCSKRRRYTGTWKRYASFVMAPMVHWPEVMVSYEASEKILFSADALATFGAL